MKCKNIKIRTKNYKKYFYCSLYKKEINFSNCNNCESKEYKNFKPIKKRTAKQIKLEKSRFSLFTDDLTKCFICSKHKNELHEVFSGSNRHNSMKYGLVIPICRKCHEKYQNDVYFNDYWHVKGQEIFEREYSNLDFVSIFKKNYKYKTRKKD